MDNHEDIMDQQEEERTFDRVPLMQNDNHVIDMDAATQEPTPSFIDRLSTSVHSFMDGVATRMSQVFSGIGNLFSGSQGGNQPQEGGSLSTMDRIMLTVGNWVAYIISLEVLFCGAFRIRFIILALLLLLPSIIFGWQSFVINLILVALLFFLAVYQQRMLRQQSSWASNASTSNTSNTTNTVGHVGNTIRGSGQTQNHTRSPPPRHPGRGNIRTFADL